jgi:hypothetical protein
MEGSPPIRVEDRPSSAPAAALALTDLVIITGFSGAG